ncbi:MAG TPA: cysteine desulfurase family protein [Roseimicrobium sp.]|nr:cysteine desulfurase family protein [Roseimicrobium sp.]
MIYFDHNATTPLHPVARDAWLEAAERYPGNPSSPHRVGARADAALMAAREELASMLGCDALDIVWTSGATESNNTVFHHLSRTAGSSPAAEVWVSAIEHPCVLESARRHFADRQRLIPVSKAGTVDLDWLKKELSRNRPALVAVMAANNETGVVQPWEAVRTLCLEHSVPFFCDAAQWVGKRTSTGLGRCDFVSGCAHKFGGPKGVGFLKVPAKGRLEPLLVGGPQEEGRRAGTENVASILSMVAVLRHRQKQIDAGEDKMRAGFRERFEKELVSALPGSELVGADSPRLWNTVSALMPEVDDCQQRWVVKLDKAGFAVSTGSACASGKEESSHVLRAMAYRPEQASRVLRFSAGWETVMEDWDALLKALVAVNGAMK